MSGRYNQLPTHNSKQAGTFAEMWDGELRNYLSDEDLNALASGKITPAQAREIALQNRAAEYDQRAQNGQIRDRHDHSVFKRAVRSRADFAADAEGSKRASFMMWWVHRLSAIGHLFLMVAMWTHIAIYHWGQGHAIGRLPLESNFLHDDGFGNPVNQDRDIHNIALFWILVWIPTFGFIYHGSLTFFDSWFHIYFFDNIVHHMGSYKYLWLAFFYMLVVYSLLALVGATDVFVLVPFSIIGGAVYVILHIAARQFGKNLKGYAAARAAGEKLVLATLQRTVGQAPSSSKNSGDHVMGLTDETAGLINGAINGTAELTNEAVDSAVDLAHIADRLGRDVVTTLFGTVANAITPPDLLISPYGLAGVLQTLLHVTILVYFVEACQNTSIHRLPWVASFAFFFYFAPTFFHVLAYVLYFFDIGMFSVYAHKETFLVAFHSAWLLTYVAIVYFYSTQYGTMYV